MNDISDCYNFAFSHGMWYDISSGDILTPTSASKLIKSRVRVKNTEFKLLAVNAMQFASFMSKIGNQQRSQKIVKMVDKWSSDTFAMKFKDVDSKKMTLSSLQGLGLSSLDHPDGLIVNRKDRGMVVDVLKSNGNQVVYKSKEMEAQQLRDNQLQIFQHQNSMKGQDRIFKLSHGDHLLFAICDGHGGNEVIQYITAHKVNFLSLIAEPFPTSHAEALDRTTKTFIRFENEMRMATNGQHSGSTMVFAAHNLRTRKVFFGYIGDSRAVFQHDSNSPIFATADHKPSDIAESRRIRSLGGNVTYHKNDVPRVNGNLATSRSFGDETLKSPGSDRYLDLVSVIPDVIGPYDFGPESVYFLASDGVFDVVKNEEVIEVLRSDIEPAEIGPHFAITARSRGSRDDISVGVVIAQ